LPRKVENAVIGAVKIGSKKVTLGYRENMSRGLDARGVPMKTVNESTMNMPVRISSDKRIRRTVNPSSKGLVATGETAKSITSKRVGKNEYYIYSKSVRGNNILTSGANPGLANRGIVKGRRVKRDPLTVTDKQIDVFENEILAQLDKVLK